MRICIARLPLIAVMGVCVALQPGASRAAETNLVSTEAALALREREECKKNLGVIHAAITAYRRDRLDLPMWLSDLVPKYIADPNVLVCPVSRRTGALEPPPLSDPRIPCSYVFEFNPLPLGALSPNDPNRTRREWKRRQMGLLGSDVPVVRCRLHSPTLNLSFDGKLFEAPSRWEDAFTNIIASSNLEPARLFANEPRRGTLKYPVRSVKATPKQLDLSKFYNVGLNENWLGKTNENYSAAPRGLQVINGTTFDLRGLVQLAGAGVNKRFPQRVGGVPVKLKCKRLHFLHSLAGWTKGDEGKPAGSYVIKFTGNSARLEIPLVCGKDVGLWRRLSAQPEPGAVRPVWESAASSAGKSAGVRSRLFVTTWTNIAPEAEIESIEIVSDPARGGLILAAISAE